MLARSMLAVLVSLAICDQVMAQPGGSGPSADRFFGFLDRNKDGRLDGDEMQRMPGPIRDAMQNARIDMSRGLSREDFARQMPQMMEEMRRRREESGGFGGSRDGGDGRGPGDYRRPDDGRGGRDSRRNTPPPKPTRWKAKARDRVTFDLDDTWRASDLNGDGQIGLYEWDRAKLSEFLRLDTNHDGLLTPREIAFASTAGTGTAPTAGVTRAAPAKSLVQPATRPVSASTPAAATAGPVGKIAPVEYEKESSEGRWAMYVFRRLDKNRDGSLVEDEWKASQSTRKSFEKYGAQVSFPTDFEKFAPWLVAVQRAEKKR